MVKFAVDPAAADTYKALKTKRKHKFITFLCDDSKSEIRIADAGPKKGTLDDLAAVLTETQPRFIVYDHEYKTSDGRSTDKLYLIAYIPASAHAKEKMLYTSQKISLKEVLGGGLFDMNVTSVGEIAAELKANDGGGDDDEDEDEMSDFDF